MSNWILHFSCCLLLISFPLGLTDPSESARPLIIALPIRIQATHASPPMMQEDKDQEESGEKQQREQRLYPRTLNPNAEFQYPQQQEEISNTNSQSNFLTWNPGNNLMVLQIKDFISVKKEDSSESEENEGSDEPSSVKSRQNWAYQGAFDFEDYGRTPRPPKRKEEKNMRSPASKKDIMNMNHSSEDTESDVYGTDPVVHFLRNKNKKNERHFGFGEIPDDPEDEFNIGDWWRY